MEERDYYAEVRELLGEWADTGISQEELTTEVLDVIDGLIYEGE